MLNKINQHTVVMCLIAATTLLSVAPITQATEFTIDEFTVTKNGNAIFTDGFDDPLTVPKFSNGNQAYYGTRPTPLPGVEANSRLVMDPYAGVVIPNLVNGSPIYMNRARLLTNTNNTNTKKGLKKNHTFSVQGLFDLTAPTNYKERFGVRLTDQIAGSTTTGDVVEVDVRKLAGGIFVEFREQDRPNNTSNTIDKVALTYASLGLSQNIFDSYDQIALQLSRTDATDAGLIYASFTLVDSSGGNADYIYNFTGSSTIFDGENFTRAEFLAVAPASVPEASTFLLFGLGLLGLFNSRRRKL